MKDYKRKSIHVLHVIQVLLLFGMLFVNCNAFSESMPPNYLMIEEICKPGYGLPCGDARVVRGKVVIIREKISHSCWAKRELSLFNNDIIATQENGRMRFGFIDGSMVTLASMTEVEITRSIYDRAAKARSLFINMLSGKARFLVCKLDDLALSEAKVKTNTAIVVATGSDFIIEVTDTSTRVTALKDTWLEIVSLAAPEVLPTVVTDFQQTVIEEGALPSLVETVSQEEIEMMLKEFKFVELEGRRPIRAYRAKYKGIFVSKDELIEPEGLLKPEEMEASESIELVEEPLVPKDKIFENIREDIVRESVPDFPQPPKK